MPVSVLYFLRQVRSGLWTGASFHRNAGHVLQAGLAHKAVPAEQRASVPFQEYSPSLPHEKFTVGFAGRPGGPDWYISTVDNTRNHGPGSQSPDAALFGEADPCFGKVVAGFDVLAAMRAMAVRQLLPHTELRLREGAATDIARLGP